MWSAVPCQTEPVAQVTTPAGELRIVVTPGPEPEGHCAAMAIPYGFVVTLRQPRGDRSVTAELMDPAAQRIVDFP